MMVQVVGAHVGAGARRLRRRQQRPWRRARGAHWVAPHLAVSTVHHLDELATLELEEKIGLRLEDARVEVIGRVDRLAHAPRQHQTLDTCVWTHMRLLHVHVYTHRATASARPQNRFTTCRSRILTVNISKKCSMKSSCNNLGCL